MAHLVAVAETAALFAVILYPDLKAVTYGLFDQYLRYVLAERRGCACSDVANDGGRRVGGVGAVVTDRLEVDENNTFSFLTRDSSVTARVADAILTQLKVLVRPKEDESRKEEVMVMKAGRREGGPERGNVCVWRGVSRSHTATTVCFNYAQALTVPVSHASARTDVLDELSGYVQATDITPTYSTTYGERYGLDSDEQADDRRRTNRRAVSASAFAVTTGANGAPTTPFQLYSYTLLHEKVADQPRTLNSQRRHHFLPGE